MNFTNIINHFKFYKIKKEFNVKYFTICLLGTFLLFSFIEILRTPKDHNSKNEFTAPSSWQKVEIGLISNYIPAQGEFVTIVSAKGKILIEKGIYLGLQKMDHAFTDSSRDNYVKAIIAVPTLSMDQWRQVHNSNAEQIFLIPYVTRHSNIKRVNYEMYY